MAEHLTVAQRVTSIRTLLERNRAQLALALPRHVTVDRMLRVALTAVQRTPKLLEADQVSLFAAIIQAAQLGLEPDGALGEAYLIPFRNNRKNVTEVQFMPGYRGLLSLVRRSGELSTVEVRAVYAKDQFKFRYGINAQLDHTPYDPGEAADPTRHETEGEYLAAVDAGPLVAVYAIARLKDSGIQWEVMRRHEVNAIRLRSRSKDDGPWVTDFDAMAKKTVLKRLCKLLPMSIEAAKAITLDDQAEVGIAQDIDMPPMAGVDGPNATPPASKLEALTQTLTQAQAREAHGSAPPVDPPDVEPSGSAEQQAQPLLAES